MGQPILVKAGYLKPSELFYRLFTVVLSLVLITIALPAFLVISLVIMAQDNGPVFYRGIRLGRNKKPFYMYKFRTMVPNAEQIIGAEIFSRSLETGTNILTWSGKFLRETRLDELPQLFNTLKGDMDLLGPRPLRPAVYEKFCSQLKGFDRRFDVRPGLFGFSQLFTPHSSPKRIRNLIDNRFMRIPNRYTIEFFLLVYAVSVMTGRLAASIFRSAAAAFTSRVSGRQDKRRYERKEPKNIDVLIRPAGTPQDGPAIVGRLKDINEEALCVYTMETVDSDEIDMTISITLAKKRPAGPARKRAYSSGTVFRRHDSDDGAWRHCYVIKYMPTTPLNSYIIHQYFLEESII